MSDLPPKEPDEHCNARKTDGSGYCGHVAGWGTDHTSGRCKYHGGNTENQEKHVIQELEKASEFASEAIALRIKHMKQKLERGEEVDAKDLDRLARTALDRTGHGPTETTEMTGEGGGDIVFNLADED